MESSHNNSNSSNPFQSRYNQNNRFQHNNGNQQNMYSNVNNNQVTLSSNTNNDNSNQQKRKRNNQNRKNHQNNNHGSHHNHNHSFKGNHPHGQGNHNHDSDNDSNDDDDEEVSPVKSKIPTLESVPRPFTAPASTNRPPHQPHNNNNHHGNNNHHNQQRPPKPQHHDNSAIASIGPIITTNNTTILSSSSNQHSHQSAKHAHNPQPQHQNNQPQHHNKGMQNNNQNNRQHQNTNVSNTTHQPNHGSTHSHDHSNTNTGSNVISTTTTTTTTPESTMDVRFLSDLTWTDPTITPMIPTCSRAIREVFHFSQLSKVQAATLPLINKGYDIFGKAKTGGGKTLAFLIPAVEKLMSLGRNYNNSQNINNCGVLIITPTRELALQILEETKNLTRFHGGLRVQAVIGGTNINTERSKMRKANHIPVNIDILIGTPGRLVDHIQTTDGFIDALNNLKILILDEADRLLDIGFKDALDKIASVLPSNQISNNNKTISCLNMIN